MTRVFEQDNRRAEVAGRAVSYYRMSGNARRSKMPIWHQEYEDERTADRLARRWAFKGKMGKPVLQ